MNETALRILGVFERHVESHGYAKANLDDVARELRISKKTIYVHFEGKRDIYSHIVARQSQEMKKQLAAAVAPLPTYQARVEAAMQSLLDTAKAHLSQVGAEEWLREYEVAADAFRKAYGDLIRELVQGGMDAGEFPPGDAHLVERMIAAMIVEYLLLVNADRSFDRDEELLQRIRRFIG